MEKAGTVDKAPKEHIHIGEFSLRGGGRTRIVEGESIEEKSFWWYDTAMAQMQVPGMKEDVGESSRPV